MYTTNQKIKILCHDSNIKENIWQDGIFLNQVPATDRPHRINCKLSTGEEIREAAPECVRPCKKSVKVMFEDSNQNYTTSVSENATDESLRRYFIDQRFNVSNYPNEDMRKCINIEIINE